MVTDVRFSGGWKPVRILVLGSDRLLSEVLAQWLADHRQVVLLGVEADPPGTRQLLAARPDVVLIDGGRQHDAALAMVRQVREAQPQLAILVFGVTDEETILDFIEAGATSYLSAQASPRELITTVEAIVRQETPCSSRVAAGAIERLLHLSRQLSDLRAPNPLTPREKQVLELVARGRRNKEIAATLDIALATVKNHLHSIFQRMGVRSRREAVHHAFSRGWIDHCSLLGSSVDLRSSGSD